MERQIIIALITNSSYLQQIKDEWKPDYIESQAASTLAAWCWEYFNKFDKAPNKEIEAILIKKLRKKKIKKSLGEEIQTEILHDLSVEYEEDDGDLESLLADSREYFTERQLEILAETIQVNLEKGKVQEAKEAFEEFTLVEGGESQGIDLSDESILARVDQAFEDNGKPVVAFTGALGRFWNDELTRGSFISILAPEKRGKTFMLLEFMMQAYLQETKVAFFQAGDMTEGQQLIRTAIYLAQKSNKEKFCGKQFIPVLDCIKNQTDTCSKKIRACAFGVFESDRMENLRETITKDELIEAYQSNKFYKNCYNCLNWQRKPWGTVWLKEFDNGKDPLTAKEAKLLYQKFFIDAKRSIKVDTYANGELSIGKMKAVLANWERQDNFVPDLILVDYADLITGSSNMKDMRHQIDSVWKGLRGMSQKHNCAIVAPTQADAKSYEQELLKLGNFSEDKRKLAHVTAMYGLNQSPDGREKKLGIMRINKIVIREDGFHESDQVRVIQHLPIGRPNLGSFM